jgi:hypothetical protein
MLNSESPIQVHVLPRFESRQILQPKRIPKHSTRLQAKVLPTWYYMNISCLQMNRTPFPFCQTAQKGEGIARLPSPSVLSLNDLHIRKISDTKYFVPIRSDSVHNQCKYVLCHFSLKMEHSWLSSMKPTKIETGEFYHHSFLISTSVWPKRTIRKEICNSSCLDTAQIGYLHEANKNWNDVPFWHSLPLS